VWTPRVLQRSNGSAVRHTGQSIRWHDGVPVLGTERSSGN